MHPAEIVPQDQRLAEIRQSHAELVEEADATEAAAHRLMMRLRHLSHAIEELRLRVGGVAMNEDMADMREAVPPIVCAKLSESSLHFGTAAYLPQDQRQIRQWIPDLDRLLELAPSRKTAGQKSGTRLA
jgi:hypothetical protein